MEAAPFSKTIAAQPTCQILRQKATRTTIRLCVILLQFAPNMSMKLQFALCIAARWHYNQSHMAATFSTANLDAAELLGGKKVLGRQKEPAKLQQLIRLGLPYAALEALETRLALTHRDVLHVLGTAPRTLARRKRGRQLSALESDRLYRLARIAQLAAATLGTVARARSWLARPNRALAGNTPLSMLDTEIGTRQIENVLARINHGMYA